MNVCCLCLCLYMWMFASVNHIWSRLHLINLLIKFHNALKMLELIFGFTLDDKLWPHWEGISSYKPNGHTFHWIPMQMSIISPSLSFSLHFAPFSNYTEKMHRLQVHIRFNVIHSIQTCNRGQCKSNFIFKIVNLISIVNKFS